MKGAKSFCFQKLIDEQPPFGLQYTILLDDAHICSQCVNKSVSASCVARLYLSAAVLLCAGEAGHRYALPNSRIMIHQPHHVISGQTSDIIIKVRHPPHHIPLPAPPIPPPHPISFLALHFQSPMTIEL